MCSKDLVPNKWYTCVLICDLRKKWSFIYKIWELLFAKKIHSTMYIHECKLLIIEMLPNYLIIDAIRKRKRVIQIIRIICIMQIISIILPHSKSELENLHKTILCHPNAQQHENETFHIQNIHSQFHNPY